MRTTGIIQIKFKDNMDKTIVKKTIGEIYQKNKDVICGMEYLQFDKEETLMELNKKIKEWCKE